MSAVVKLSSKLPGDDDTNGIDSTADDLADDLTTLRVGVVWYDVQKVTHDADTGTDVPTIRIRRFEPLGTAENTPAAVKSEVQAAVSERTGRPPIPFGLVELASENDPAQLTITDA